MHDPQQLTGLIGTHDSGDFLPMPLSEVDFIRIIAPPPTSRTAMPGLHCFGKHWNLKIE
jgi:hypothetical protein